MASRSIICRIPRLRQTTDLRDTAGEITILCDNRVQNFFYYSVITFVYIFRTFSNNSGGSRICHFSHKSAWLQLRRIFAAKTHLVSISHNQIVCRQLFPSHEVVFRPIRRTTEKMHRVIIVIFISHFVSANIHHCSVRLHRTIVKFVAYSPYISP